jgi:hypothetical protein
MSYRSRKKHMSVSAVTMRVRALTDSRSGTAGLNPHPARPTPASKTGPPCATPPHRFPGQVHPTARSLDPYRAPPLQLNARLQLFRTVSGTKTARPPVPRLFLANGRQISWSDFQPSFRCRKKIGLCAPARLIHRSVKTPWKNPK